MKKLFVLMCCLAVSSFFAGVSFGAEMGMHKGHHQAQAQKSESKSAEPKKECHTYECVDKSCEIMAKIPIECPMHHKMMKKKEVKYYCPNCGKEVSPAESKVKPAK